MDKVIKWKKKYLTGCTVVDLQHQYFADLINRIVWEIIDSKDTKYNQLLLEELVHYAQFHFISEENMLYKTNQQELKRQHKLHRALIETLNQKINTPDINQKPLDLINFLVNWFVEHTVNEDVRSFKHLKDI
ncbi:MAG: hemerythrin domain-containing protein [Thermodesulfovibrionales bacterium]|nr:hemerythrin domain-containing protein [Thermodesulfovibrionales bacterium]